MFTICRSVFQSGFLSDYYCEHVNQGFFQEIHARNLVQKNYLLWQKKMFMLFEMAYNKKLIQKELVMEDIVIISAGEQVPSDMEVIDGKVEANEALLTGESDLIEKEISDTLLSGSFIVSGQAYARVIHVGAENYAVKNHPRS